MCLASYDRLKAELRTDAERLAVFPALTRALEELFDAVNLDKDDPKRLVAIKNAGGVLLQVRGLEETK